jgi:hypothetical protein
MYSDRQLRGDALALEFLVNPGVVRLGKACGERCRRVQARLQDRLIHPLGQGPGQALGLRQAHVLVDRPLGQSKGTGDFLVAEFRLEFQPQDIGDLAHWNPLARHHLPHSTNSEGLCRKKLKESSVFRGIPGIVTGASAIVTADSGKSAKIGHDETESAVTFARNGRPRSI